MNNNEKVLLFLLDNSNNIKREINIIKPQSYEQLLTQLTKESFNELPDNFYIFYKNEKNKEIKVNNDKEYKLCKDILFIREKVQDELAQSNFEINYNKLSDSKQDILDNKFGCNICNDIIKKEKPYFCYRCQKIFHQNCLADWDKKTKSLNQKLSCPNCKKELPLNLWEKKLNYEDERINEAQLIDKINLTDSSPNLPVSAH